MRSLDGGTLYAKQRRPLKAEETINFCSLFIFLSSTKSRFISELLRCSCLILCFLLIYKNVHGFITTMMRINRVLHLKLDPTI